MNFREELTKIDACKEAIEWVGDRTLEQAWNECERGDWMLWLAQKNGVDIRPLTLAKARCAKLVVHLMEDERSVKAVEIAERFGLGQATRKELGDAADAASAVFYASASAYAAYVAASAAASASYAASYAYSSAALRQKTLKQCADICRETLTKYILL